MPLRDVRKKSTEEKYLNLIWKCMTCDVMLDKYGDDTLILTLVSVTAPYIGERMSCTSYTC